MKRKLYLFRIGLIYIFLSFSAVAGLAQDSLNPHSTPINLTFKFEKERLDQAAERIASELDHIIWLLGSNKTGRKKSTVISRLKKSKQYLIEKHKIPAERINLGYEDEYEQGIRVRIFIVPKNTLPPVEKENVIIN